MSLIQGPRTKQAAELAWSRIKRAVQARVNYDAQVWREEELNRKLAEAWDEFKDGLDDGELLTTDLKELGPGAD